MRTPCLQSQFQPPTFSDSDSGCCVCCAPRLCVLRLVCLFLISLSLSYDSYYLPLVSGGLPARCLGSCFVCFWWLDRTFGARSDCFCYLCVRCVLKVCSLPQLHIFCPPYHGSVLLALKLHRFNAIVRACFVWLQCAVVVGGLLLLQYCCRLQATLLQM